MEAIDPQEIVISVGAENTHEHPHEDMVEIYEDQAGDDHVWQTPEDCGTLVMTVTGEDSLRA